MSVVKDDALGVVGTFGVLSVLGKLTTCLVLFSSRHTRGLHENVVYWFDPNYLDVVLFGMRN